MHGLAAGDPAAQRRFQETRSSEPHRASRCFAQLAGRGLRPIEASASPGLCLAVAAPTRRAGCQAGRGLVGSGDAIAEHGDAGNRACALPVTRLATLAARRSPNPWGPVPRGGGHRTAPAGSRGAGSCEPVAPISRSGPERRRPVPGQGTGLGWAFNVVREDACHRRRGEPPHRWGSGILPSRAGSSPPTGRTPAGIAPARDLRSPARLR